MATNFKYAVGTEATGDLQLLGKVVSVGSGTFLTVDRNQGDNMRKMIEHLMMISMKLDCLQPFQEQLDISDLDRVPEQED